MAEQGDDTLVVYVAFADFGEQAVQRFLRSYTDHVAGRPHRFLLACKNYGAILPDFTAMGAPADSLVVSVPNRGFDLGTYRYVAERFAARRYCLLNSRSRILVDGWLGLFEDALALPGVAAAGATASRQSLLTDHLSIHRHARDGSLLRRMVRRSPINAMRHWVRFRPFPNSHLRTNALLIERDVMLKAWSTRFPTKPDTAQFENGRGNLTERIERMGRRAVVVGREGVFEEQDWARSETFWNGDQSNLLIADNQTDRYAMADAPGRQALAALAWGEEASPLDNNRNLP